MRLWQLIRLARLFNRKPSRPIATLQVLEAVDGDTRGTRGKLQQAGFLLRVPTPDALPEVLDHFVVLRVAAVVGVLLPVLDVNLGDTADEELELALVKHVHEIGGDELVETGDESLELLLDALLDPPLGNESAIVSTVHYTLNSQLTRRIRACSRW
jgi:hypothetical protein